MVPGTCGVKASGNRVPTGPPTTAPGGGGGLAVKKEPKQEPGKKKGVRGTTLSPKKKWGGTRMEDALDAAKVGGVKLQIRGEKGEGH